MIELISVVDGFNVILGSWVVHLAAFLTLILCFAGRLPKYEGDPDKTKQATIMYALLVFLHLVLAVVKFISLYRNTYFNNKMTIFIMIMVFMTCELCQNWVFDRGEDINTLTKDQIKFERWLWIELQFIISFIFGGIFFLLCSKIKRPVIYFPQFGLIEENFGDFVEANGVVIDLTCNFSAPAIVGIILGYRVGAIFETIPTVSGWLCIAQTIFLYFAIFPTRVSE